MEVTDTIKKAHKAAVDAYKNSHSPYSKFAVGSAVVDKGGRIFSGCNVENASFGATVCAERIAIFKSVSEGSKQFTDVIVITGSKNLTPPCGMCLQVMAEFCKPSAKIWLGDLNEIKKVVEFKELNPQPFTSF